MLESLLPAQPLIGGLSKLMQGTGEPAAPEITDTQKLYQQGAVDLISDNLDKSTTEVNKALGDYAKLVVQTSPDFEGRRDDKNALHQVFKDVLDVRDAIRPEFSEQKSLSKIFKESVPSRTEQDVRLMAQNYSMPLARDIMSNIPGEWGKEIKATSQAIEAYKAENIPALSTRNVYTNLVPQGVRMGAEFALTKKLTGFAGLDANVASKLYQNHPWISYGIQSANVFAAHNLLFNTRLGEVSDIAKSTVESYATGFLIGPWSKLMGNSFALRLADSVVFSPAIFGAVQTAQEFATGTRGGKNLTDKFLETALQVAVQNQVMSVFGKAEQKAQFAEAGKKWVSSRVDEAMRLRGFEQKGDDWFYKKGIKPILKVSENAFFTGKEYASQLRDDFDSILTGMKLKQDSVFKNYMKVLENKESRGVLDNEGRVQLGLLRTHLNSQIEQNIADSQKQTDRYIEKSVSTVERYRKEKYGQSSLQDKMDAFNVSNKEVGEKILQLSGLGVKNIKSDIVYNGLFREKAQKFLQGYTDDIQKVLEIPLDKPIRVKVNVPVDKGYEENTAAMSYFPDEYVLKFNINPTNTITSMKDKVRLINLKEYKDYIVEKGYLEDVIKTAHYGGKINNPIVLRTPGQGKSEYILYTPNSSAVIKRVLIHELAHASPLLKDSRKVESDKLLTGTITKEQYQANVHSQSYIDIVTSHAKRLVEKVKEYGQRGPTLVIEEINFKDKMVDNIRKMAAEASLVGFDKIDYSKASLSRIASVQELVGKQYTTFKNKESKTKINLSDDEFSRLEGKTKDLYATRIALDSYHKQYKDASLEAITQGDKGLRQSIINSMITTGQAWKENNDVLLAGKKEGRFNPASMTMSMRYWLARLEDKAGGIPLRERYLDCLSSINRAHDVSLEIGQKTATRIGETVVSLENMSAAEGRLVIDYLFNPTEKGRVQLSGRLTKVVEGIKETLGTDSAKFVRGVRAYLWLQENSSNIKKLTTLEDKESKVIRNDEQAETGKPYTANLHRGINPEGPVDFGMYGKGEYYSPDIKYAEAYADTFNSAKSTGKKGKVIHKRVSLENPFVINISDFRCKVGLKEVLNSKEFISGELKNWTEEKKEEFMSIKATEGLKALGHDGVILTSKKGVILEVVSFNPKKQVKDIVKVDEKDLAKKESILKSLEDSAPANWKVEGKYKDISSFLKMNLKLMTMDEEARLEFLKGEKWGTKENYFMSAQDSQILQKGLQQRSQSKEFSAKQGETLIAMTDVIDSFTKPSRDIRGPARDINPFVAMINHLQTVSRAYYLFPRLREWYSELSNAPMAERDKVLINELSRNMTGRYRKQDPVTALASMIGNQGWKVYFMKPSNIAWFSARQAGNVMLQLSQVSNYELAMAGKRMASFKKSTGDWLHPETREMFNKDYTLKASQKNAIYSTLAMQDLSKAAMEGDLAGRLGPIALRLSRIGQVIVPKMDDLVRMMWIPTYEVARNNLELYSKGEISYNKLAGRLSTRTFPNSMIKELNQQLVNKDYKGFASNYATWKTENANMVYNQLGRTPAEQYSSASAWLGLNTFTRGVYELYWQNGVKPFLHGSRIGDYKMAYQGMKSIIHTGVNLALTKAAMVKTIGFRGPYADFGPISSALIASPMSLGTGILTQFSDNVTSILQIMGSSDDMSSKANKIAMMFSKAIESTTTLGAYADVFIKASRDANDKQGVTLWNLVKEVADRKYKIKSDESLPDFRRTAVQKFQDQLFGTQGTERKEEE